MENELDDKTLSLAKAAAAPRLKAPESRELPSKIYDYRKQSPYVPSTQSLKREIDTTLWLSNH